MRFTNFEFLPTVKKSDMTIFRATVNVTSRTPFGFARTETVEVYRMSRKSSPHREAWRYLKSGEMVHPMEALEAMEHAAAVRCAINEKE